MKAVRGVDTFLVNDHKLSGESLGLKGVKPPSHPVGKTPTPTSAIRYRLELYSKNMIAAACGGIINSTKGDYFCAKSKTDCGIESHTAKELKSCRNFKVMLCFLMSYCNKKHGVHYTTCNFLSHVEFSKYAMYF